jgi:hypothetical protein
VVSRRACPATPSTISTTDQCATSTAKATISIRTGEAWPSNDILNKNCWVRHGSHHLSYNSRPCQSRARMVYHHWSVIHNNSRSHSALEPSSNGRIALSSDREADQIPNIWSVCSNSARKLGMCRMRRRRKIRPLRIKFNWQIIWRMLSTPRKRRLASSRAKHTNICRPSEATNKPSGVTAYTETQSGKSVQVWGTSQ